MNDQKRTEICDTVESVKDNAMKFNEQINHYLELTNTTQKELADTAGLSTSTISRYCSGKKEPSYSSTEMKQIAAAFAGIASARNIDLGSYEEILSALQSSSQDMLRVDYEVFLSNLKYLMDYLNVRSSELARGIHVDSSNISKILSGTSHPGNINHFISSVAVYLAHRFSSTNDRLSLASLLGTSPDELTLPPAVQDRIARFLGSHPGVEADDPLPHFLTVLDQFDLNDYLKKVHFDDIKLPPAVPHLTNRKEYTGLQRMMDSELDFISTTIMSRSMEDSIQYSDMPLEEMAADPEFIKKYMIGMAMMLKKGLHFHIIHDVNRPLPEMMIGLESWIPLYMTGQISPYYFPSSQNSVFCHLLKVSGSAALEGTAISGNQKDGKYILYRSREDIEHCRTRARQMLDKAQILMDIYRSDRRDLYHQQLESIYRAPKIRLICSSLPLMFLSRDLLNDVLNDSDLPQEVFSVIMTYYDRFRPLLISMLEQSRIQLILPETTDDETGLPLSLSDLFLEESVVLDQRRSAAAVNELEELAQKYPSFETAYDPDPVFRNTNITIIENKYVVVSKEKSPAIHFVIHHRKMVCAFQDYNPYHMNHQSTGSA